ncbi:MAG: hypothetical protein KDB07_06195 [Planctomycetes bacterium]|nr:hypothetical protein [Planctomycetota bacterium]
MEKKSRSYVRTSKAPPDGFGQTENALIEELLAWIAKAEQSGLAYMLAGIYKDDSGSYSAIGSASGAPENLTGMFPHAHALVDQISAAARTQAKPTPPSIEFVQQHGTLSDPPGLPSPLMALVNPPPPLKYALLARQVESEEALYALARQFPIENEEDARSIIDAFADTIERHTDEEKCPSCTAKGILVERAQALLHPN